MKTKELEQELGLTKHTIRYYEKEGFIHPSKDESGYRNYSKEDLQVLQLVKFLRNLNISIDDVKGIIEGQLSFDEALKVNEVNLDRQIESLKEVHEKVIDFKEKELPILPVLETIDSHVNQSYFGINKTTQIVSLGRRLTKAWAKRQAIYAGISSLALGFVFSKLTTIALEIDSVFVKVLLSLALAVVLFIVFIGMATRQTSAMMLDNSMNQSVEFLREGIRYYQFKGFTGNLKYYFAVLLGNEEKYMHDYRYEEIKKVKLHTNRKYMKIATPIAHEVYVVDFEFAFQDGNKFYFFWPMILDDDARYIAYILEDKVKDIIDSQNVLYAMKNGINITDYMMNKQEV